MTKGEVTLTLRMSPVPLRKPSLLGQDYDELLFAGRNVQCFNFSSENITDPLYGLFHIETYSRGKEI